MGSKSYIESLNPEDLHKIIAMLNFDTVGSGDVVEVEGDSKIVANVLEYGYEVGIITKRRFPIEGYTSDHATFQRAGIPVVFFATDDISRIHTQQDKLEFVQDELMGPVCQPRDRSIRLIGNTLTHLNAHDAKNWPAYNDKVPKLTKTQLCYEV